MTTRAGLFRQIAEEEGEEEFPALAELGIGGSGPSELPDVPEVEPDVAAPSPRPAYVQRSAGEILHSYGLDPEQQAKVDAYARAEGEKASGMERILAAGDQLGAAFANGKHDTARWDKRISDAGSAATSGEKEKQARINTYAKLVAEGRRGDLDAFIRQQREDRLGRPKPEKAGRAGDPLAERRITETERANRAREENERRRLEAQGVAAGKKAETDAAKRDAKGLADVAKKDAKAEDKNKGFYLEGYELDPKAKPAQAEIIKLRSAQATTNTIEQTTKEIGALYRKHGAEALPTEAKARMTSLITDLKLAMKGPDAYQLGVLAGPDMAILDTMVPGVSGSTANIMDFIGSDQVLVKLETLASQVNRRFANSARSMGYFKAGSRPSTADPAAAPAQQQTKVIDGKTYYLKPNGKWAVKE